MKAARTRRRWGWVLFLGLGIGWPAAASDTGRSSSSSKPRVLQREIPEELAELAARGIHANYLLDFEEAEATFQRMIETFPDHPGGYLCMAGLLESRMIHEGHNRFEKRFYRLLERCLTLCEKERGRGNDAAAHLFRGGALGYRGLHRWRKGEHLAAFRDGTSGVRALKRTVELDPDLFDAYYGLGLYDYYKAKYGKVLTFIPFVQDTREQGLEELRQCMEKGIFSAAASRTALMWILAEEERYEEALSLADWMIENYPTYWDAYHLKAVILRQTDRKGDAVPFYRKAIEILETVLSENELKPAELRYDLTELLIELERYDEAEAELDRLDAWEPRGEPDRVQEGRQIQRKASGRLRRLLDRRRDAGPEE